MDIQFPAVLSMSIDEARIVHKALTLYRAENLTIWPAMHTPEEHDQIAARVETAAQMAKALGDHIEHYEHLDRECGDVVSQYMPGGLYS